MKLVREFQELDALAGLCGGSKGLVMLVVIADEKGIENFAEKFPKSILNDTLSHRNASLVYSDVLQPRQWDPPIQYQLEMGSGPLLNLLEVYSVETKEVGCNDLVSLKESATFLERDCAAVGKRSANINVGAIWHKGVIALSWKQKSYRLQISSDVWGQWMFERTDAGLVATPHAFSEYIAPRREYLFSALSDACLPE